MITRPITYHKKGRLQKEKCPRVVEATGGVALEYRFEMRYKDYSSLPAFNQSSFVSRSFAGVAL